MIGEPEREMSLEEILESNDFILCDTSTFMGWNKSITYLLYDVKYFNQLDSKIINAIKFEQEKNFKFIDFLKNDNVFTIKQVTEEIKNYYNILGNSISFLNKNERFLSQKKYLNKYKKRFKNNNTESRKQSLIELQDGVYSLYKIAKNKEHNINDKNYEILLKIVKVLSDNINLGNDNDYIYGIKNIISGISITDQNLVASMFWKSIYSEEKTALISGDFDFGGLLGVIPRIIGSDELLPENNYFREKIKENPIKLYLKFPEKENFKEIIFDYEFEKCFNIYNVSNDKNSLIKEEIAGLLKQFSQ